MFIKPNHTTDIAEQVAAANDSGNEWVAYEVGLFVNETNDLHFFANKSDAADFIDSNTSDLDQWDWRQTAPLLNSLKEIEAMDDQNKQAGYFYIDGNYKVSADTPLQLLNSAVPLVPIGRIEQQLTDYPIAELRNPAGNLSLLKDLENRELCWITLERTIVPADYIGDYVLLHRQYPQEGRYESGYTFETLGKYRDLDMGLSDLNKYAGDIFNQERERKADLLLIGRYRNKELQLGYEGNPVVNTSYLVATANSISGPGERSQYTIQMTGDLYSPTVVQESFMLQFNGLANRMEFINKEWDKTEIDQVFWRKSFFEEENLISIKKLLDRLEFPAQTLLDVENKLKTNRDQFTVFCDKSFGPDGMEYALHFNKNETGFYYLTEYTAVLNKAIQFDDIKVNGVDLIKLESAMQQLDWSKDMTRVDQKTLSSLQYVIKKLEALDVLNASYMKAKYWAGTPFGKEPEEKEMFALIHASLQTQKTFPFAGIHTTKTSDAFEEMRVQVINKNAGVNLADTELLPKSDKKRPTRNNKINEKDRLLNKNREGTGRHLGR